MIYRALMAIMEGSVWTLVESVWMTKHVTTLTGPVWWL